MNNRYEENGARTGPLIFTVPAYGFVMALYLDWLGGFDREQPLRAETSGDRSRLNRPDRCDLDRGG
jgi:hypothetical protein